MNPTARPGRIWKNRSILLWTGLSALAVFLLLALIADLGELQAALGGFPALILLPVAGLSLGNYLLRYLKWQWYLKITGHPVPAWPSMLIFLSGFGLTVTPGKVGEFIKVFILKKRHDVPYTVSTAVLLVERFTDVAALLVLTCIGISLEFLHWSTALAFTLALLAFLAVLRNRKFMRGMIALSGRFRPLEGLSGHLRTVYDEGWALLEGRVFALTLLLSVAAWFLEGAGYALVAWGFGAGLTLLESAFVYAASLLGGVATIFVGGLGATEGGMVGLGMVFGMSPSVSAASTIVIRVMTLWFAVVLGWTVFLLTPGLRALLVEAREG